MRFLTALLLSVSLWAAEYQLPYEAPPAVFQQVNMTGFERPITVPTLESILQQVLASVEHPSIIKQVVDGGILLDRLVEDFEGNRIIYCALYKAAPECGSQSATNQIVAVYRDSFRAWAGRQPCAPYGGTCTTVGPPFGPEEVKPEPVKPIIGACWSELQCGPGPGAWDVVKHGEIYTHHENGRRYKAVVSFGLIGGKQIAFVRVTEE